MFQRLNINSKIYPDDYKKPIGTLGIKLPMNWAYKESNSSLFSMSYTTEDQAISNMINLLLTRSGERYMQPVFGVGLLYYIFEQKSLGTLIQIESEIENQINTWLPYILIDSIDVGGIEEESEHNINIRIKFKVTESGANRTISIFNESEGNINVQVN